MSAPQQAEPKALRKGRERYQRRRERAAIKRVEAYLDWCRAGSELGSMPPVPRDWEFKLARKLTGAERRRAGR